MPEHYSVSQFNCYLQCARKYRFRYVEGREAEFQSSALSFGKAMHSALASYHESIQAGRPLAEAEVQALFRADWEAEAVLPLRFGVGESAETLLALGQALLAQYVAAGPPEVVASEEKFEVLLRDPDTGEVLVDKPFVGVFDLLTPTGFVEFKTARSALDENTLARMLQLSAYAYSYQLKHHRMPQIEVVQFLKLKKTPRIERCQAFREWSDIRFFLDTAAQVVRGIEASIFPANPTGFSCVGCEYAKACREG